MKQKKTLFILKCENTLEYIKGNELGYTGNFILVD